MIGWFALLLILFSSASCYDTGHHNDLTRNALQIHGYNEYAQRAAGAANFFVDYYAFTSVSKEQLPELNRMHFDNIFSLKNASNYWTQFTVNSRRAVQQAVQGGDVLEYIMTMGGTLHTVQDFYTHSSWVDTHLRSECNCFRSNTWLGTMHGASGNISTLIQEEASIHTYSYGNCDENSRNCHPAQIPHGTTCEGINKDSYMRPYWEESYGFAFSASVEWIDNIHKWATEIDATIIGKAKAYTPPSQTDIDDLSQLDDYLKTVSYALKFRENDGHWKGSGSGSLKRFLPAIVKFTASNSIYKQKYQDTKIHLRWTNPNVYDFADVDATQLLDTNTITKITRPFSGMNQITPVIVRTVNIKGPDSKKNTPSYFATVNINDLEFVENVQVDYSSFSPFWTSIKFVNKSQNPTVPIVYTLKNNHYPRSDDIVSINPNGGDSITLTYNLASHNLTGDINGVYDSIGNVFTTKNDNANVEVQMFVTSYKYDTCATGLPQQFCPNEAYVTNGAFPECKGETINSGSKVATTLSLFILVVLSIML